VTQAESDSILKAYGLKLHQLTPAVKALIQEQLNKGREGKSQDDVRFHDKAVGQMPLI